MAKSSMGAARMRRSNRRIQHQEAALREIEHKAYKPHVHRAAAKVQLSFVKRVYQYVTKWFDSFLSIGNITSLKSLDFRIDRGSRGRGARQLRAIFGQSLKMISTRDGKPV